jgi:hypothetical protein
MSRPRDHLQQGEGTLKLRILILVLLACPSLAVAQQATPVDSGRVVRLHRASGEVMRGRLLAPIQPEAPAITYCHYPGVPCRSLDAPGVRTASRTDVLHLDVAGGSRWKRGALIGGAAGVVMGALMISFAHGLCETSECRSDAEIAALVPVALGVSLGTLFGSTSLTWRPVW